MNKKISDADKKAIVALHAQGQSVAQIAAKFKVTKSTIYAYVNAAAPKTQKQVKDAHKAVVVEVKKKIAKVKEAHRKAAPRRKDQKAVAARRKAGTKRVLKAA